MNTEQILKKSWENLWRYRALWVFGVILALTTTSWGSIIFHGNGDKDDTQFPDKSIEIVLPNSARTHMPTTMILREQEIERIVIIYKGRVPDFLPRKGDLLVRYNPSKEFSLTEITASSVGGLRYDRLDLNLQHIRLAIMILIGLFAFGLIMLILIYMGRYISTTALIQMVDQEAHSGSMLGARQGLRLGWSRAAWRLFLIDVCLNVPALLMVILLFVIIFAPVLMAIPGGSAAIFTGAVITGGLFFLAILATILGVALLALVRVFIHRACVLEGLGVFTAILSGITTLRSDLKGAGLVWLVWVGLRTIWPIFMLPVGLLLLGLAIFIGGLPALLVGGMASLFAEAGDLPVILGGLVGVTLFMLSLIVPLVLLEGLLEVYISSMWTLTYREMHSREANQSFPAGGKLALEGLNA